MPNWYRKSCQKTTKNSTLQHHWHFSKLTTNMVTHCCNWGWDLNKHLNCEGGKQSMEWRDKRFPRKLMNCLQPWKLMRKIIASMFWDREGVLVVDFFKRGITINAGRYCESLSKLRRAIQNKFWGKLSYRFFIFILFFIYDILSASG